MAKRPVFVSKPNGLGVIVHNVEFDWFPGMAASQKKKSIDSLHRSFQNVEPNLRVLEISSKSSAEIGVELSAFNLKTRSQGKGIEFTVETAFQSSKVFELGGPYRDILAKTSREAKADVRLRNSGALIGFNFLGKNIPTKPRTIFYDWLYINVLLRNEELHGQLLAYDGFTDIEFNPEKSVNCQAFSAALFVSLMRNKVVLSGFEDIDSFIRVTRVVYQKVITTQTTLI